MTTARSLLIAMVAAALLIGARPMAGDEQFPSGLMASAEQKAATFCTIDTRPLSFGNYDSLAGTDLDAIGQIIYTCSTGTGGGGRGRGGGPPPGRGGGPGQQASNQGIRIEMAQGYSSSFAERMMASGHGTLSYNIYLDATHRTVWGDGTGSTQYYVDANPPNRTPVIVSAFGRIRGGQDVEAGQYSDNVPVRILF